MGVLDQVIDLRNRGASDQEIIRVLQEQGVSPAEINDAFSRAQIKNAVSRSSNGTEGMEHSLLGSEEEPDRLPLEGLEGGSLSDVDLTPPTPGGSYFRGQVPMTMHKEVSGESSEMYAPQETYYPQEQPQYPVQEYAPQAGYQYSAAGIQDTDTMIEVAEQVFMEKGKSLQKKLDEVSEFRALAQTNIDNISERLRKIESVIDRLQASILEKVGGYGQGLDTIKKEMSMMQDSFGKMINSVADKSEEKHHKHHSQHQTHTEPSHHTIHHTKKTTVVHKSHKSKKHSRKR